MNTHCLFYHRNRNAAFGILRAAPAVLLGLFLLAALPVSAQDKKSSAKPESQKDESVGFVLGKTATAKDVGLPLYPGSRPHRDDSDESSAVKLGLWGPSSGFKLAVLKLDSDDAPEKVAPFYRKALAQYGKVLNCADPPPSAAEVEQNKRKNMLDCEADRPENGGIILKSGTREKQHVVGISPNGAHSLIHLVYVESRDAGVAK
jgi:hypothetical protein